MKLLLFLALSTWHVASGEFGINWRVTYCNDSQIEADAIQLISENQIHVATTLYKAVANNKPKSFAVSTADVFLVLAQLYSGAEGRSREQLSNILHYTHSCFGRLGLEDLVYRINDLQHHGARMKNAIFHAYESGLEESFEKTLDITFRSVPQQAKCWRDIATGVTIYEWSRRAGIPYDIQLFEAEDSLVFVSAATFSTKYVADEFNACYIKSPFYYNENIDHPGYDYVKLTTRLNYGELKYHRNSNKSHATAQFIELTWEHSHQNKIKTIFILPNEGNCITELEENIDLMAIEEILANMSPHNVIVTLPRSIKIVTAIDLTKALKNMQLTEMFNKTTDFAKIIENEGIKVGPILHQVRVHHEFVNVFEPCANSSDDQIANSSRGEWKIFNANRAFMLLNVYKDKNPFILSMGRYGWTPGVCIDDLSD